MRVIGTAGHVDHGKSTLVQALTGTHPDRLKEEREREMTIDLGFAFLKLPDDQEIGIVDVPGHRDFIENMLSGVGGIDAALFVVAADEGVMPQTREHLAILDLLQIEGGIVALTKVDLVDDADWLDLVEEEVRGALAGTILQDAPIIRVSARKGLGVDAVLNALEELFRFRPFRTDFGNPRLPIDRVFSIAGFGTVVTGTLLDGALNTGIDVDVVPAGVRGRIRGLQTHNRSVKEVDSGNRVAVNISGVSVDEVPRGNWVVRPGTYPISRRLDLQFRMLGDASAPLKHNSEVKFFIGAAEVMGRVRVLGSEAIAPGTSGWLQIELAEPVVARRSDRYIIRRPSPGETIGGGEVIDPEPTGRHKRFSDRLLDRLEALAGGTPEDVFLQAALASGLAPLKEITRTSSLDPDLVDGFLPGMLERHEIELIGTGAATAGADTLAAHPQYWRMLNKKISAEVSAFLQKNPLRAGVPREELRSKLKISTPVFNQVMDRVIADRSLDQRGSTIIDPGHEIRFSAVQQKRIDQMMARFAAEPYGPPSVKDCSAELGEDVLRALIDLEQIVQVSVDVVFRKQDYDEMVNAVREMIARNGIITVGEFRDRFKSSRKYALGLLEHLDSTGVTYREGEGRKLRP